MNRLAIALIGFYSLGMLVIGLVLPIADLHHIPARSVIILSIASIFAYPLAASIESFISRNDPDAPSLLDPWYAKGIAFCFAAFGFGTALRALFRDTQNIGLGITFIGIAIGLQVGVFLSRYLHRLLKRRPNSDSRRTA